MNNVFPTCSSTFTLPNGPHFTALKSSGHNTLGDATFLVPLLTALNMTSFGPGCNWQPQAGCNSAKQGSQPEAGQSKRAATPTQFCQTTLAAEPQG